MRLRWIATAILSLLLYAGAVWSSDQYQKSQFAPEQMIVLSGLAHAVHGTPIGSVYQGYIFSYVYRPADIHSAVAQIKDGAPPEGDAGQVWSTLPDGLGIVMVTIVSLLFRVFGSTLSVFPILAVVIPAISAACLIARFPDSRLIVAPFHFLLLSASLLTPAAVRADVFADFAIGGVRFVGLLAILPGIHIALEMLDRGKPRLPVIGRLATVVQLVLFMLCQNVRGGVAYLLLATATLVIAALWFKASGLDRRAVAVKALAMFAVLVGTGAVIHATAPLDYQREGRVSANFWHRLFVSLGTNPKWPFGNLKEKYDLCVPPAGVPLQPSIFDTNGMCIWIQHVRSKGMTDDVLVRGVLGGEHERLTRAALFDIIRTYPEEVLETFYRDKPKMIYDYFFRASQIYLDLEDTSLRGRIACMIGLLALFLWSAWRQTAYPFWQFTVASGVFLAWSFLPPMFAWGGIHTLVECAFWYWAVLLCAAVTAIKFVEQSWRNSRLKQAS